MAVRLSERIVTNFSAGFPPGPRRPARKTFSAVVKAARKNLFENRPGRKTEIGNGKPRADAIVTIGFPKRFLLVPQRFFF